MSRRRRKTLTRRRFLLVVIFDMIDSRWTFVFFLLSLQGAAHHRHLSTVGKYRLPFNPVCRLRRPLRRERHRPPIWRRARRRLAGRGRSGARNGGRARGEPVKAHHRRGNEAAKTPSTFPTSVCIALGKSEFKCRSLVFQPRSAYLAEIELEEGEQWS